MADESPNIVVHTPPGVSVDDSAKNVTAAPVTDLGPLPPPPRPRDQGHVMLRAPDELLDELAGERVAEAAQHAAGGDGTLSVSFDHAVAVDSAALERLAGIGEREGVSHIHVYVRRRG